LPHLAVWLLSPCSFGQRLGLMSNEEKGSVFDTGHFSPNKRFKLRAPQLNHTVGRIVTTKRCTITEKMVARDRHRPADAGGVE